MKFILMIAWGSSYGGFVGFTAQEFNSLDACKSAVEFAKDYRAVRKISCISKDSGYVHEIINCCM